MALPKGRSVEYSGVKVWKVVRDEKPAWPTRSFQILFTSVLLVYWLKEPPSFRREWTRPKNSGVKSTAAGLLM